MTQKKCLLPAAGKAAMVLAILVGVAGSHAPTVQAQGAGHNAWAANSQMGSHHSAKVLRVGSYHGTTGDYSTIQAAVDAANPGDWILIGPGVYHEQGAPDAGVLITTPGIHLRGMDRNKVVVDGSNPGSKTCSSNPADQNFGPGANGRNGVEIYKVDGVSVENLTVCNFIGGVNGNNGNEIWWNGGDGSGQIGMGSYFGSHLTASSTFYQQGTPNVAQYGIFASNAKGPGVFEYSYASNMADSSFYVGACPDCNSVLRHVHAQYSPQGFSGSNAGGHLILEDSEWDHNQAGIVSSALANDDPPSPQDGACPNATGKSCTFIQRNYVHDNNNPNTPGAGLAATAPVGSGIILSGGRNNTVQYNLVVNNGAWGILLNDYPDYSPPEVPTYCQGGIVAFNMPAPYDQIFGPVIPCYFESYGNRVKGNVFYGNGSFGNPTNGDLANAVIDNPVNNCFQWNIDVKSGMPTSAPLNLQDPTVAGTCGAAWSPDPAQMMELLAQLLCDSVGPASGACSGPPGYPLPSQVVMMPIPREKNMSNPCAGVPENNWCPGGHW